MSSNGGKRSGEQATGQGKSGQKQQKRKDTKVTSNEHVGKKSSSYLLGVGGAIGQQMSKDDVADAIETSSLTRELDEALAAAQAQRNSGGGEGKKSQSGGHILRSIGKKRLQVPRSITEEPE